MKDAFLFHIIKIWFKLTAWFPRKLPDTIEKLDRMLEVLKKYFGLEAGPDVWITVLSQIGATPPTQSRRSLSSIATVARRLKVNKLANDKKAGYYKEIQEILAQKIESVGDKKDAEPYIS